LHISRGIKETFPGFLTIFVHQFIVTQACESVSQHTSTMDFVAVAFKVLLHIGASWVLLLSTN
jgi:hypothetical protein